MQLMKGMKIRKYALNLIKLGLSGIDLWILYVLDPCRHVYAKQIEIKMLLIFCAQNGGYNKEMSGQLYFL